MPEQAPKSFLESGGKIRQFISANEINKVKSLGALENLVSRQMEERCQIPDRTELRDRVKARE